MRLFRADPLCLGYECQEGLGLFHDSLYEEGDLSFLLSNSPKMKAAVELVVLEK